MSFWGKVKDIGGYAIPGYNTVKIAGDLGITKDDLLGSTDSPTARDRDYLVSTAQQGINDVRGRQAPQAGRTRLGPMQQMATGQSDQFRNQQMGLAQQLNRVASGQEAGAGELAVQRQAQRALGNAAGAATMARGNSAVGGARAAARAAGAIGLGAAGQAQQAALGDQAQARSLQAGLLGQGREQDIGIAGANQNALNQGILQQGSMDQQLQLANMEAKLKQMGMNDAAVANYLQTVLGLNSAELGARQFQPGALGQAAGIAGPLLAAL